MGTDFPSRSVRRKKKEMPSCGVKWCPKAKECVGEEMYNMLMQVGEKQKGRQKETA